MNMKIGLPLWTSWKGPGDPQESRDNTLGCCSRIYLWKESRCKESLPTVCQSQGRQMVSLYQVMPSEAVSIYTATRELFLLHSLLDTWSCQTLIFVKLLNGASFHAFWTLLFSLLWNALIFLQFSITDLSFFLRIFKSFVWVFKICTS